MRLGNGRRAVVCILLCFLPVPPDIFKLTCVVDHHSLDNTHKPQNISFADANTSLLPLGAFSLEYTPLINYKFLLKNIQHKLNKQLVKCQPTSNIFCLVTVDLLCWVFF
jgi:hypothetical protein